LFAVVFFVFRVVGHRSVATDAAFKQGDFQAGILVTGPSMAPTLWGPNAELTCTACEIRWQVHWQPEQRPQKPFVCWNCGESVSIDDAVELPGDRVVIRELSDSSLQRGDMVAIAAEGWSSKSELPNWGVKRVAAVPGQTISHQSGWLFADGKPLSAIDSSGQTLWIEVHDDSFRKRGQSWWRQRDTGPGIGLTGRGFIFLADSVPTTWLDYQHFAVHDSMRPDVVRDDVPGNATEVRALLPVDSLGLTFKAVATEATEIEVVFQIGDKTATIRRELPPENSFQTMNFDEAVPANVADTSVPPISIRLRSGQATLSNIVVWRPLRYRIDPRLAAKQTWPIVLDDGEYYLLGDNVPLSIDSRDWGPIPRRRIVGRIDAVGYDEQ